MATHHSKWKGKEREDYIQAQPGDLRLWHDAVSKEGGRGEEEATHHLFPLLLALLPLVLLFLKLLNICGTPHIESISITHTTTFSSLLMDGGETNTERVPAGVSALTFSMCSALMFFVRTHQ